FKRSIPLTINKPNITPRRIEPVGQYALRFYWSDRHSTGIYTFQFIRELCSCEKCT
ncbi:MAG: DUF971 domain-containing protein, partial [Candidatus Dadabacteria bacterium]|nr:DUF971 domain-containing protein [Candidatus Dadabacteria bacterium]